MGSSGLSILEYKDFNGMKAALKDLIVMIDYYEAVARARAMLAEMKLKPKRN